jgi:hypothetical protein
MDVRFYPMLTDFRNSIPLWRVLMLHAFALLVRATRRWRWVWSNGGMIVTGENRSSRRDVCQCHFVHLGVTLNSTRRFLSYRAVTTLHPGYKNKSMLSGGNNRCVFGYPLKTHKCVLWAKRRILFLYWKLLVRLATTMLRRVKLLCQ